jgi:hypothetical protein
VEAKCGTLFSGRILLERSGFGLNELLGRTCGCTDRPTVITVDAQQLIAHKSIALCVRLIVTEASI